jgi:hypothetical protein
MNVELLKRVNPFRPPSVPLVTFDPYLSIWSAADHLTDRPTQHWTKRPHSLVSLIRVDGATYRLMGNDPEAAPPCRKPACKSRPRAAFMISRTTKSMSR